MALVVGGAAEAAVATGSEAAVLDRAGAQVAVEHPGVHQHNGHVALRQVCLDVLHTHGAVGRREVSRCQCGFVPISQTDVPSVTRPKDLACLSSALSSLPCHYGPAELGGKAHHFSTCTLQALACANSWFTRVSSVSKCFL